MRLIAVTGHSGKTTTAWLVASVLGEAGLQVGVVSDLGCVDADGTLAAPPDRTRPDDIVAWISRLARGGCTHAVVEVPHDALALGVLGRRTCHGVVVTGAARGPRDERPSRSLLERRAVAALAADGWLVAPPDRGLHGLCAAAADRGIGNRIVAGLDDSCDVSMRPVERGLHGQTLLVSAAGQVVPVAVDPPVASFARNAACAAAIGVSLGLPLDVAARGIEAAGSVAGRVERLDRGQDFAAFLDAPSNRHALASTLASLRRLTPGRLAVVAEQGLVDRLGAAGFARPVRRRCDDVVVVPPGVLDDVADEAALAAYARIDLMLGRLGRRDCLLVLGSPAGPARRGRPAAGVPLATLVDGWLRLAHPPQRVAAGPRRAA
jgi:UDP-N-acetylmuramoyl-L-alanyl-D-glutamate--2,6-diaminopimelate ligase